MAVYRGLDIGTAKASRRPGGPAVHLTDLADPDEDFSVARFQAACRDVVDGAHGRGHRVVYVGGTGLYHRAVTDGLTLPGRYPEVAAALELAAAEQGGKLELHRRLAGLDPLAASRITPGNGRRLVRALEVTLGSGRPFSSYGPGLEEYPVSSTTIIGLSMPRAALDARLEQRLEQQMEAGFLEEVRRLASCGTPLSRTARQAIGYKELIAHLKGESSEEEARAEILRRLKASARRQEAWFRRDPRVHWLDGLCADLAGHVLAVWSAAGSGRMPCETRQR